MKADKVIKSNVIFDSIADEPFAGGIAIKGNKIQAVVKGEGIDEYIGPDTEVMEFTDKLVMPSFIDAHMHFVDGAINYSDYMCSNLIESSSEAEAVEMLKAYADAHPDETTIRGTGWHTGMWGNAPLPTKKSLDEAFPDKPVFVVSADLHTMWLNSKALEVAGVSTDWVLKSGKVGVDENGEMNGLLFEPEAWCRTKPYFFNFTDEQWMEIYGDFFEEAKKWGITGSSDMAGSVVGEECYKMLGYVQQLADNGTLAARLHVYMNLEEADEHMEEVLALKAKTDTEKLDIAGMKSFIDGTTSVRTAYMMEPYSDDPTTCGDMCPLCPQEIMEPRIIKSNANGLQVRVHSIGDMAVRMCLDMFEASKKVNGDHGCNNAVEHIEQIHPADIPRFAELDVIPSMQPMHLTLDATDEISEKVPRCGMERAAYEWVHKSILKAGGQLAFGTDFPVVHFNPFPSVHAAVSRVTPEGLPCCVNPWECIELSDTLKAYTIGASKVYNTHNMVGTLKEGMLADIVVVDCNLFDIPINDIQHAVVNTTIFDGNVVYTK